MNWTRRDARLRIRALVDLVPLSYYRELRHAPKEHDVHFVVSHWGPSHEEDNAFRLEVMDRLHGVRGLDVVTGFASDVPLPPPFEARRTGFANLREHLRQLSRSRIAVYVRGMHDCLSFKVAQHLGLGLPVVGQTLVNDRASLYSLPEFEAQYAFDDPRALVARVAELAKCPAEQARLGAVNASTFDAHLTPAACMTGALSAMFPAEATDSGRSSLVVGR